MYSFFFFFFNFSKKSLELEKEMATHSSTLAWKIPWMEERGWSMGLQRVGHDWATSLHAPQSLNISPCTGAKHVYFLTCVFIYLAAVSGLSCGTWGLHCVTQDLSLWCMGSLVVVHGLQSTQTQKLLCHTWHLSSPTRDRTLVLCISRQILNHCTRRSLLSSQTAWIQS